MNVPPLTLRLEKGSPLTSEEGDNNLKLLRDFANGLAKLFEVVFNPDGTLKNGTIGTSSLKDRAVTQAKLDWLANFYGVASGVDSYTLAISPSTGFAYGDGIAGAFFCIVKFTNANTGAATLDVNGGGAKAIKKNDGGASALVAGDIVAGSVHVLTYDGTNFQMLSPPGNPAGVHGIQVITAGSGNWTVPQGVYAVEAECVGGGGGGGAYSSPYGGGGGGYVSKRITVTPGDSIAYSVGVGGTASSGAGNAGNGADTTFGALTAGGGKNGDAGLGAGGTATGGDVNLPGENGAGAGGILSAADKRTGGTSGRGMGFGGFYGAAFSSPTGYGGGGYGDTDSGGGPQTSAGGDGVLIIRW